MDKHKNRKRPIEEEVDDFQPPIIIHRKTHSVGPTAKKKKGKEKVIDSADVAQKDAYETVSSLHKYTESIPEAGPLSVKKSKALIKAEKAYEKRNAKYEAKAELQQASVHEKLSSGKALRCPTCGGTDHQRSTSKLCKDPTTKRKPPKNFNQTRVIKASLSNTCQSTSFVANVRECRFPRSPHQLCYTLFALIAGEAHNADESLKNEFATFQENLESKFKSKGFMTVVSSAAKEYEEAIRNHVCANFQKKTTQYLLICMSDKNDEAFWESSTVKDRNTMAEYMYKKICDMIVNGLHQLTKIKAL
ncbi:hypothetical protein EC973_008073 [Apophysomyces ossiformis]|uniref:Uncharacterized protein n=1 Tax=Apophysomyces ossiformis TaxID=679940 RepID=A0A8H7BD11_9FUNG|nr:hypothetical protein EC973_008073 [Apophysomyces ossiformis]